MSSRWRARFKSKHNSPTRKHYQHACSISLRSVTHHTWLVAAASSDRLQWRKWRNCLCTNTSVRSTSGRESHSEGSSCVKSDTERNLYKTTYFTVRTHMPVFHNQGINDTHHTVYKQYPDRLYIHTYIQKGPIRCCITKNKQASSS